MSTSPPRTLPPELFVEILSHLDLEEDVELSSRTLYVVAQTNRMFRELAFSFMCHSVEVSWDDVEELACRRMTDCFSKRDSLAVNKIR